MSSTNRPGIGVQRGRTHRRLPFFGGCDVRPRGSNRRVRTPRAPLSHSLVTLCFLAVLALPSQNPLFAAGQNKIVYDQFDWSIYQSTHFDVFHYSRERQTLQKIVSMAESRTRAVSALYACASMVSVIRYTLLALITM